MGWNPELLALDEHFVLYFSGIMVNIFYEFSYVMYIFLLELIWCCRSGKMLNFWVKVGVSGASMIHLKSWMVQWLPGFRHVRRLPGLMFMVMHCSGLMWWFRGASFEWIANCAGLAYLNAVTDKDADSVGIPYFTTRFATMLYKSFEAIGEGLNRILLVVAR